MISVDMDYLSMHYAGLNFYGTSRLYSIYLYGFHSQSASAEGQPVIEASNCTAHCFSRTGSMYMS